MKNSANKQKNDANEEHVKGQLPVNCTSSLVCRINGEVAALSILTLLSVCELRQLRVG